MHGQADKTAADPMDTRLPQPAAMQHLLQGVRVTDLTQNVAGPIARKSSATSARM